MLKVHGHKYFIASEETEIKENHLKVTIIDLVVGENQSKKIIDTTEIILMVRKLKAMQICRELFK
jgi:hypothetical protein